MSELPCLSGRELVAGYRALDFSPVEVVEALATQIERVDSTFNAFTTLALDTARSAAARVSDAYVKGEPLGELAGVPFAAKDVFDTAGVRTTYGSKVFASHVPTTDAEAVRRMKAAGAILIGKTTTHEFAWGITSENPHHGASRNPWNADRVSGGSSGGSAVALAAHEAPLALASDTGGSIRVPAAFCGVVGLKPTYGRVSGAGAFPLAPSLDHPGAMARSPGDIALVLQVIAGVDENDSSTEDVALGELDVEPTVGLQGARVGIHVSPMPLAADVQRVWANALGTLVDLGAELHDVDIPTAERMWETFVVIQRAEALFTHTRRNLFPNHRDAYGADVLGRLEAATAVTLPEYLGACEERQRIRAGFARVFKEVDLLVTPVSPCSPMLIGQESVHHLGTEIEFRELVMKYTVPQDLTGLPACAIRAGFDDLGIPVGIQLTAPAWDEARVLRAAQSFFEGTRDVQDRWPIQPGRTIAATHHAGRSS